jgi:glycosyltransferase involved in cell wall biosynthesis
MRYLRFVYVKPRDAIEEYNTLTQMPDSLPDGGPVAYVAHFLRIVGLAPVLFISLDETINQTHSLSKGNIEMLSFSLRPRSFIRTFLSRIGVSYKTFALILKFRPTHILCWQNGFPLWLCYLASRIAKSVFVPSRHNRFPVQGEPWLRQLNGTVNKWIIRRSSAVICHGPYLKHELLEIGLDPLRVFEFNWSYQYLLNKTIDSSIDDLTEAGSKKLIVFIGRMAASKGIFDLLEACVDRLQIDSSIKLVYAGDGPDLSVLKLKITDTNLLSKVLLLGRLRHDRVQGLLKQSIVLVTPTQSKFPEGRCMATIEGLVLGVPVIAPDFGPFRYLVQHNKNGLLFKPDSVPDLRDCINMILDNEALHLELKRNIKEFSEKLINPPVTFHHAIVSAFNLSSTC